jgi:hypothetical protein
MKKATCEKSNSVEGCSEVCETAYFWHTIRKEVRRQL